MNIIGLDMGMGALKLCAAHGRTQLLSQIALDGTATLARMSGLANAVPPLRVEFQTQAFYVGPRAHAWGRPVEALDYGRLAGAPEFYALILGALSRVNISEPARLIVGLPVEMTRGEPGDTMLTQIKRALKGTHEWRADGETHRIEIADVRVTSQAAGALFDFVLDDPDVLHPHVQVRANAKSLLSGEVGIVSIGFNTVELMALNAKQIIPRFTDGDTVGVRRLLEQLNTARLYSLAELDAQLRHNQLDISAALPVWQREVVGFIEATWGKHWRRFARVIVVGGGAILLRDAMLAHFGGKALLSDDPVHSIARGLYKLGASQK